MSRQRRIRDETGNSLYYDIDESDVVTGAGVFDTMKSVASSIASKLTGKAAKKIATKAVEKGAEKVGEKTGQLIGEKIYNRFSQQPLTKSPPSQAENKGDQIIKELQSFQRLKKPVTTSPGKSNTLQPSKKSISQQFDDLLNL